MADHKCAFPGTLLTEQFACCHASIVARRGGPDIACQAELGSKRCQQVFELLKTAALPAFDTVDDLTVMPHSVMQKIQYGGLLGIQSRVEQDASTETVADIDGLLARAQEQFQGLAQIPCQELVGHMTAYKLRRRRDRRLDT